MKPGSPGVGLALSGHRTHVELLRPLAELVDFLEICPEQLWNSQTELSSRVELYDQVKDETGKPFVAHGLGLSLGTPLSTPEEVARTERWLSQIARLHERLELEWYTDHLGASHTAGGLVTGLHTPLPHTDEAVQAVKERLERLQLIVPLVGFENTVFYFTLDDPMEEASFYNRLCRETGARLLLDLHNVYAHCRNFGLDPLAFVGKIDLSNVLELHLSGGSESDPGWLEGPVLRLDSHDGPVPEPVWELFDHVLPRCPAVRGVTLERIEGTIEPEEVPLLRQELERIRLAVAQKAFK